MFFLAFSNADVKFDADKPTWKKYTIAKAMPTAKRVELIDKHKFLEAALSKASETFLIHMTALEGPMFIMTVDLIRELLLVALDWNKAPTKLPVEYNDFANVFLSDLAIKFPDNTGINEHIIKLIEGKPLLYTPIYSLSPAEIETLKTYIETLLKTGFICLSEPPTKASILFDKKLDKSLPLCINYRGLNNLTNKNRYPLLLIDESLNKLEQAKRFIQLELTNTYYRIKIKEGDQ